MHHAENGQAGRSPEMHVEPVVLDILDSKGLRTLFRAGTAVIHGASVALATPLQICSFSVTRRRIGLSGLCGPSSMVAAVMRALVG